MLEDPGIAPRAGYDCWRKDGGFGFRTLRQAIVWQRRAAFFRVNATGRIYRVYSRWRTVEVRARWGRAVTPPLAS